MCDLIKGDVMGKFVAREFTPVQDAHPVWVLDGYAFDSAWEAWDHHAENRLAAEALAAGGVVGTAADTYAPLFHSAWGDMNELAQAEGYDDANIFGVATCGYDWEGSNGTGVIWARTPGHDRTDLADRGICYQVTYEENYVGL